jgi:uncharacterized protein
MTMKPVLKLSSRRTVLSVAASVVGGLVSPGVWAQTPGKAAVRQIQWSDLVPKGWDPSRQFKGRDVSRMDDKDPKVIALMKEVRDVWDNAPTRPDMAGQRVKLPGYLVPVEGQAGQWSELLLVPYFGACIHTPPPPANQIVHVKTAHPIKGLASMDTIWVTGTLQVQREDNDMGVSGYAIHDALIERYTEPSTGRK